MVATFQNGTAETIFVQAAVALMTPLNATASEMVEPAEIRTAIDITGFGARGHLFRILQASGLATQISVDQVPLLPGAVELVAAGFVSSETWASQSHLSDMVRINVELHTEIAVFLHDAQNSGGLLVAIPVNPIGLLTGLRRRDCDAASVG
jgi:selenide, water dikinase